jgi:hypothetical protein
MELDILLGTQHAKDALMQKEERRLKLLHLTVEEEQKDLDEFEDLVDLQAIRRTPRELLRQGWDTIKGNRQATALDKALWLQQHLPADRAGQWTDTNAWLREFQTGAMQQEKLGDPTAKELELLRRIMEQLLEEAKRVHRFELAGG